MIMEESYCASVLVNCEYTPASDLQEETEKTVSSSAMENTCNF